MAGNSSSADFTDIELDASVPVTGRSGRVKAFLSALLTVTDVIMLSSAFVVGYYAREVLPIFAQPEEQPPFLFYVPTMILHVSIIMIIMYFSRMYHQRRTFSRFDQWRTILGVVTLGTLVANGSQEFLFRGTFAEVLYPRSMLFYVWFFSTFMIIVGRELNHFIKLRLRARGHGRDNLLIIGTGRIARDLTGKIKKHPELGYNIVGVVTDDERPRGRMLGIPIVGNYLQIPELIDEKRVEQVIIALPDARRSELVELITMCQRGRVDIKVYPDIFAYMAGDLNVDDLAGTPLLTVRDIALRGWKLSIKRGLDIVGSLCGLIFLSPLMLFTALLIWLETRGPVFYSQERMGLDGRPFPMIKFRSMVLDAEARGPGWTVEGDPRVTRIGRFLRRSNWDEIPQLINVLLGQMSLVGPRPERPFYVQQFRESIPRYMERHREKAGMTGWAQVNGLRGDTSIPARTSYDLWYVENWSLLLDIKIIIRTIFQAVLGRSENAY